MVLHSVRRMLGMERHGSSLDFVGCVSEGNTDIVPARRHMRYHNPPVRQELYPICVHVLFPSHHPTVMTCVAACKWHSRPRIISMVWACFCANIWERVWVIASGMSLAQRSANREMRLGQNK